VILVWVTELTFAGYGIINGTLRYNDDGTGIYITNPNDGAVYQKGIIEISTEDGSDRIKTIYESVSSSDNDSQSDNRNIVLERCYVL
jgi:hypothetical protein